MKNPFNKVMVCLWFISFSSLIQGVELKSTSNGSDILAKKMTARYQNIKESIEILNQIVQKVHQYQEQKTLIKSQPSKILAAIEKRVTLVIQGDCLVIGEDKMNIADEFECYVQLIEMAAQLDQNDHRTSLARDQSSQNNLSVIQDGIQAEKEKGLKEFFFKETQEYREANQELFKILMQNRSYLHKENKDLPGLGKETKKEDESAEDVLKKTRSPQSSVSRCLIF